MRTGYWPPAKMLWLSAGVIPVRIVWEPPSDRVQKASCRLKFCRNLRKPANPIIHGPSGRMYCGLQAPMKKAVNGAGACPPNDASVINGSVKQLEVVEVDWVNSNGKMTMVEKPGNSQNRWKPIWYCWPWDLYIAFMKELLKNSDWNLMPGEILRWIRIFRPADPRYLPPVMPPSEPAWW